MEIYIRMIMIKKINFISVIICSRTKNITPVLTENIKDTIGCDYELIVIDNSENHYSIFEAYNLGIEKSKGEYLCFIHDDILFHTIGWGDIVNRIFNDDEQIGLIGVAGAKSKTKMPSAWWNCEEKQKVINIIQHIPNKVKENWNMGIKNNLLEEVVAIDGVFMVARKDDKVHFNENLTGFHNYDLNISFEYIKNGYKILVTNEILLEHFSLGTINEAWINSTFKIHSIYKKLLPLLSPQSKINKKLEVSNAIKFINQCLKFNKYKVAFTVWFQLLILKPISKYHIYFWKRILKIN
ncbi:MAG TPA: glycosyltransferase [Lutibacter sp.]